WCWTGAKSSPTATRGRSCGCPRSSRRIWESERRVLEVESVRAGYGQAQALWDVSLRVGDGEIVTIIGPNGAGKSTLVNVIAGINPEWGGRIDYDRTKITVLLQQLVCTAGVAVLPEGRKVFADMTVTDNLLIGGYLRAGRDRLKE